MMVMAQVVVAINADVAGSLNASLELPQPAPHAVAMSTNADIAAVTESGVPPLIDFTAAAAAKVRELIREEGNEALKLRVYIQGGGCSGFQYGFEFDEQQNEDDLAVRTDEVTLVIDPLSLQYLVGAQVDYTESLHGAQFVIRNPNAKTTCGCGSSFSA
jgi:iron-sulfur cluster insertion protein